MKKEEEVLPTELELVEEARARLNFLISQLKEEGVSAPGALLTKLGRINQRYKELT